MRFLYAITLLYALALAIALPPKYDRGNFRADIDPDRAKETAKNMREYVQSYGPQGMTVKYKDVTRGPEKDVVRNDAIGGKRRPGVWIDEQPPASFRKLGDPYTTRETTGRESRYEGGVLRDAFRRVKESGGPESTITHGIQGENLWDIWRNRRLPDTTGRPADAAMARHRGLTDRPADAAMARHRGGDGNGFNKRDADYFSLPIRENGGNSYQVDLDISDIGIANGNVKRQAEVVEAESS